MHNVCFDYWSLDEALKASEPELHYIYTEGPQRPRVADILRPFTVAVDEAGVGSALQIKKCQSC